MIKTVKKTDAAYPLRMKYLKQMPEFLYVRGNLPSDEKPSVAIVGARSCSHYGRNIAFEFARILSQEGVQIISGLALGIDGEAHVGAMKGKTPTYAVMANDVNVCYPKANQRIYDKILESGGGILGEYPEGIQARPYFFPARNRIISALADLILVVEARQRSGALITVDYALEQGKTVYAVPGRIGDVLSEGCNHLIEQGAAIACSPAGILQELGIGRKMLTENFRHRKVLQMSAQAQYIYGQLDTTPISLEDLCHRVPYTIHQVQGALLELQMEQVVMEISKNYFVKSSKFS